MSNKSTSTFPFLAIKSRTFLKTDLPWLFDNTNFHNNCSEISNKYENIFLVHPLYRLSAKMLLTQPELIGKQTWILEN